MSQRKREPGNERRRGIGENWSAVTILCITDPRSDFGGWRNWTGPRIVTAGNSRINTWSSPRRDQAHRQALGRAIEHSCIVSGLIFQIIVHRRSQNNTGFRAVPQTHRGSLYTADLEGVRRHSRLLLVSSTRKDHSGHEPGGDGCHILELERSTKLLMCDCWESGTKCMVCHLHLNSQGDPAELPLA